jgi:hypothetical protein
MDDGGTNGSLKLKEPKSVHNSLMQGPHIWVMSAASWVGKLTHVHQMAICGHLPWHFEGLFYLHLQGKKP